MTELVHWLRFSQVPAAPWRTLITGGGQLWPRGNSLLFANVNAEDKHYSNAQVDDYQGRPRRKFRWRPPLRFTVRAKFSHPAGQLKGTAGFGFWNDPFLMTGWRWPSLPRAVWFFYSSPPSNIKLDHTAPGFGWKAATIDAWTPRFGLLAPLTPLAMPLMRFDALYQRLWPLGQQAITVNEAMVSASMTAWQTYRLDWLPERVRFWVNDDLILETNASPRGPLGFVMWFDNQYLVLTPWGKFGYGLVPSAQTQWMAINFMTIDRLNNFK